MNIYEAIHDLFATAKVLVMPDLDSLEKAVIDTLKEYKIKGQ
jgi:lipoate-protein ligase B